MTIVRVEQTYVVARIASISSAALAALSIPASDLVS
jgi:hypothetical protein